MSWDLVVRWGVWAELQKVRTLPPSESLSQPVDSMVNVVLSSGHCLPRREPWRPDSEEGGTIPEAPSGPFPQPMALSVSKADKKFCIYFLKQCLPCLSVSKSLFGITPTFPLASWSQEAHLESLFECVWAPFSRSQRRGSGSSCGIMLSCS